MANDVVTIGTDSVGLILEKTSPDFRRAFSSADLVVARGMGNYETLTDEKAWRPIAFFS